MVTRRRYRRDPPGRWAAKRPAWTRERSDGQGGDVRVSPHDVMDAAVLIPVKRFSAAKRRLAGLLDAGARAELARWLAGRVVDAARPSPVFVACDDDGVATWADAAGAEVLWSPGLGLNGAVDAGRATIAGKGFDHLVIVHSDIPLAHDLGTVARAGTVTLVPDRRRAGTNVARPARCRPGSCVVRQRVVHAAPGPRDASRVPRRGPSRSPPRPRRRQPRRPGPPAPRSRSAAVAANDPGQPPLSPAVGPGRRLDRQPARAHVGPGGRRAPRRRRVRRRRHARQVGRRRVRRAPPRVHRRVEGHLGSVGGPDRARRPADGRAARGSPAAGRGPGRRGRVPRPHRRRAGQRPHDPGRRGRGHPPAASGGRARSRPLEALPAPSGSPPRRRARLRRHRGGSRSALPSRARHRAAPTVSAAALGGGPARARRGRRARRSIPSSPPSRRIRASSSRR